MRASLAASIFFAASHILGCGDAFQSAPGTTTGGTAGGPTASPGGSGGKIATAGSGGSGGGSGTGASGSAGGAPIAGSGGASGAGGTPMAGAGGASAGAEAGGKSGSGGGCAIGFQCTGDALQSCDIVTGKYATVQVCKAGFCNAKLGQCDDCTPGEPVSCADSSTVKICGANGKLGATMSCATGVPHCTGKGQCVECVTANQCPAVSKECVTPACTGTKCGAAPLPKGTTATTQVAHDCKTATCDGVGGVVQVADPTDLPLGTGDPCTVPTCNGTVPTTAPASAGGACNAGMGVCNGAGACGECVPGGVRCVQNAVETCDPTGHWSVGAACATPTPVCSAGKCTAVVDVVVGLVNTCAVLGDGTLRCWGANNWGQVGRGDATITPITTPTPVNGVTSVTGIAVGQRHVCALTGSGVLCWGSNKYGALGDGSTVAMSTTPVAVSFASPITQIGAGFGYTCAVAAEGVWCWGDGHEGEVGPGPGGGSSTPVLVLASEGVQAIAIESVFSCALLADTTVQCWGYNQGAELGTGTASKSKAPSPVIAFPDLTPLTGVTSLAVGRHGCAETPTGTYCWSYEIEDDFGDGAQPTSQPYAVRAPNLDGWKSLTAGLNFTCGIYASHAFCTGRNYQGQCGLGNTTSPSSLGVPLLIGAPVKIAAGDDRACAIVDGDLFCWGTGGTGAIGDGQLMDRSVPTKVAW